MEPIFNYLQADILPDNRIEARRIKAKATKSYILYGKLYKKSFTRPYLRCVTNRKACDVMKSLHYEECGNHSGARSLANRAITAGYYWPTMRTDSQNHVKLCDKCQQFAPVSHLPPILTDYFTKWVEVGAYQQVRDIEVCDFVWKNIICRFGVPREIVTDNGSQFISYDFKNFCDKFGIKLSFSTPQYPQANGQAESTNKTIINTLKKQLEVEKSEWVEKLPEILWSYRTTPRRSTGETPFSLVYGSELVIPIKTRLATARSEDPNEEQNNLELSFELDHLDEHQDRAALRIHSYQQQVTRHYNKKVRARVFKLNDWVLRHVFQNTREEGTRKLGPTWESPYQITEVVGRGAYKLRGLDGRELHNSWNALHLKQYHF
ncbi:hypothetical protein Q3G72_010826 [Acer saccharum]|nr:hypothetical protein Q3G72_010826 [Acer saccharum]